MTNRKQYLRLTESNTSTKIINLMISLKRERVHKDYNVNLKYNVQKEAIQLKFVEFFLLLRKIIICLV